MALIGQNNRELENEIGEAAGNNSAVQFNNLGNFAGNENKFAWNGNNLFIGSDINEDFSMLIPGSLNITSPSTGYSVTEYAVTFENDISIIEGSANTNYYLFTVMNSAARLIEEDEFFVTYVPTFIANNFDISSLVSGATFPGTYSGDTSSRAVYFGVQMGAITSTCFYIQFDADGTTLNSGSFTFASSTDIPLADGINFRASSFQANKSSIYVINNTDKDLFTYLSDDDISGILAGTPPSQTMVDISSPTELTTGLTIKTNNFTGHSLSYLGGDSWSLTYVDLPSLIIKNSTTGDINHLLLSKGDFILGGNQGIEFNNTSGLIINNKLEITEDIVDNLGNIGTNNSVLKKVSGQAIWYPLVRVEDDFINDAAAGAGSIDIGGYYHTSGVIKIRLS